MKLACILAAFAGLSPAQYFPPSGGSGGAATSLNLSSTPAACTNKQLALGIGTNGAAVCQGNTAFALFNNSIPVALPNATIPVTSLQNAGASGNVDIYTVPNGRSAFCNGPSAAGNPTGGSISVQAMLKSGGSYYIIGTSSAVGAGAYTNGSGLNTAFVFNAGESLAVNLTASGLSVWYGCVEYDATGPLKRTALLNPSAGDNTLYTVPAGKTAFVPAVVLSNNSGGTRTLNSFAVLSGGSSSGSNKVKSAVAVANSTISGSTLWAGGGVTLAAGDFVVLNDDAATASQGAWAVYIEQ